jgi:multicomponent Na+:H+ antiporter subunit G
VTPTGAAVAALVAGCVFFFGLAVLALFRLPDLFSRAHATSKADTLGALFGLVAAGVAAGGIDERVKLAFLFVFLLVTSPTAGHAIARAAYAEGYAPWTRDAGEGGDRRRRERGDGRRREREGGRRREVEE